jgi:DNA invertase Pin-like site-specific DNA recombinase/transposase
MFGSSRCVAKMAVYIGRKRRSKPLSRHTWEDLEAPLKRSDRALKETEERLDEAWSAAASANGRRASFLAGGALNRQLVDQPPSAGTDPVWDDIDRLTMASVPLLVEPPIQKIGKLLRVAVYARFSHSGQKPRTIAFQEKSCVLYYGPALGAESHTLFADYGETGTNADREALEALLEAVADGKFDVVVVYAFDRISREIFDGVPVIKILQHYGVELHVAHRGQKLNKKEAVRDAIEAEEDKELRRDRCMGGVDGLVEEEGGVPWGAHFGLKRTLTPGHPEIDKDAAPIVQRITRDIRIKSAADIANELTADGILTPDGHTCWNPGSVLAIAKRIANTGRVHFRVTSLRYNPKKRKREQVKNPEYKRVKGINEDIRLVSDEEYIAARTALAARSSKRAGHVSRHDSKAMPIFGNPVCDCPGADSQTFSLIHEESKHSSHDLLCSNARRKCCPNRSHLPAKTVELAIFDAIVPHLSKRLHGFDAAFRHSLGETAKELDGRRAILEAKIAKVQNQSEKLLRSTIASAFDDQSYLKVAAELKEKVAKLRAAQAAVPRISVDEIDFDGTRQTLLDAFVLVRNRVPFVPQSDEEFELICLLQQGVTGIKICQQGRLPGSFGLEIEVMWERYFLSEEQVSACKFAPEMIRTEFYLPYAYGVNTGSREHLSDLAATGLYALTDPQWSLVQGELPDLTCSEGYGRHKWERNPTETRSIVHCILFITRMNIPTIYPPRFFGERRVVYHAMLRFIFAGGIETLTRILGAADPGWLEGLNFDRFDRKRRSPRCKTRCIATQPRLAAARYAEDGRFDLSDEQWNAISHALDPKLEHPLGRSTGSLSLRTAFDGILLKLRTGCSWSKMPVRYGNGLELYDTARRICYHGAWSAAYAILERDFPGVVEGLSSSGIQCHVRPAAAG